VSNKKNVDYNFFAVDEDGAPLNYSPVSYKGKPVEYRGKISDRESLEGKEEGIYYLMATGSGYCYYDGVARGVCRYSYEESLDLWFEPNPHNPEVADMKPCWYSALYQRWSSGSAGRTKNDT
tara:strand:+ start:184 stop:549 length:366 start_codon:yes stop_codon:yes gene_type:complete